MELSLKEAAEALGISLTTARRWVKTGRLRAVIREGPYGPEYVVTWEELERAKRENPAPVTVVAPQPTEQQGVTVPREWLAQAMRQALEEALSNTVAQMTRDVEETLAKRWVRVEERLKEELAELRRELAATRELLDKQEEERRRAEAERDRLLEERDRRLVEEMRRILQDKRKPWWKFWSG